MDQRTALPRLVAAAALLATVVASLLVYPDLPDRMATHWNAAGEVDDTMAKSVGAFAVPALTVFTAVVMYLAPKVDPGGSNVESFRGAYEWFVAGTVAFLGYVHGLVLCWNLGLQVPIGRAIAPPTALLFYGVGLLLERVEPNWTAGARTPWTLSDEAVWEETHRRGARAFKLAAVVALGGVLAPSYAVVLVVVPVVLATVYLVGYSMVAYRRRERT